jgi:hypothetical protein
MDSFQPTALAMECHSVLQFSSILDLDLIIVPGVGCTQYFTASFWRW